MTNIVYLINNILLTIITISTMFLLPSIIIADEPKATDSVSFSFMNEWESLRKSGFLPRDAFDADLIFPKNINSKANRYEFNVSKGSYFSGNLYVSKKGDKIEGFSFNTPYVEYAREIVNKEAAYKIANQFLKEIGKNTENYKIVRPTGLSTYGVYDYDYKNIVEDIELSNTFVSVNYLGFVTLYSNHTDIEFIPEKSPGADNIIKIAKNFLTPKEQASFVSATATRKVSYYVDITTVVPRYSLINYFWDITIDVDNEGNKERLILNYNETDKKVGIMYRDKLVNFQMRNQAPIIANHPVWNNDGTELWWSSSIAWQGLPTWITQRPVSLVNYRIADKNYSVFRPLADTTILRNGYELLSPSPDGQWLTYQISINVPYQLSNNQLSNNQILTDMVKYKIYNVVSRFKFRDRASWRDDNNSFVVVNHATVLGKIAYYKDMSDPNTGLKPIVKLAGVEQMEYLSGNEVVATIKINKDEDKWILKRLKIIEVKDARDVNVEEIEVVKEFSSEPYRMHVSPDKKSVIIAFENKIVKINLAEKIEADFDIMSPDKLKKYQLVIDYKNIDWSMSPDQNKLAFSAYKIDQTNIGCICIANMDGTDIYNVNPDFNTPLNRYAKGKVKGIITKFKMTADLLESLRYIDSFRW